MSFLDKIKLLRSKAQEAQAATKIIDQLRNLESKNDENTSFRWIWELIQNAKDVPNSSGTVDIEIVYDEINSTIEFKHNGKFFTTENIIFLIEQVSTKERGKIENKKEKTTGKFGTGFLTTHLLSKKVKVLGCIQDDGEKLRKFEVELDRSSEKQNEIIKSIEDSCNQLETSAHEISNFVEENGFNTSFIYFLDYAGKKTAEKGLKNLLVSAPYVFAFVSEINSITVKVQQGKGEYYRIFQRGETRKAGIENGQTVSILIDTNGEMINRYIFTLSETNNTNLKVAVEVNRKGEERFIGIINNDLPKLFCDFPLLGTNDFPFPIVINCKSFNPTEPRDGIFLTSNIDGKEDSEEVKENKENILKAIDLFNNLLDYFLNEKYKCIYNIVKIIEPISKYWLSADWFDISVSAKLKEHIEEVELIESYKGNNCKLADEWDNNFILIPNHENQNVRLEIWNLLSSLYPHRIPKKEELEFWYNSLWDECHNYTISDLIESVQEKSDLVKLASVVNGNVDEWLKNLYKLIYSNNSELARRLNFEPQIIPNQNKQFCKKDELVTNYDIDNKYIEIANLLDIDLNSKIIYKPASTYLPNLLSLNRFTFEDLCIELQNQLRYNDNFEFYKEIACLKNIDNENQTDFLAIFNSLYAEENLKTVKINKTSDSLYQVAIEKLVEKMADDCEETFSVEQFAGKFSFSSQLKALNWLTRFLCFLIKQNKISKLKQKKIFPDQNGSFIELDALYFDNEKISEETKDVSLLIGNDIRCKLLNKYVGIKLHASREMKNDLPATRIVNFIRQNKNKLGKTEEEKQVFLKFYNYLKSLSKESETAQIYEELINNLHWFFNEEDIANNMTKVKDYDNVLNKYGVKDISELEKILSSTSIQIVNEDKIEISKELLAEWGITSEAELLKLLNGKMLDQRFKYTPSHSSDRFNYAIEILQRSKNNVTKHLEKLSEYDLTEIIEVAKTVFLIKKNSEELYIIARPSDYHKIVIFYDSELDVLDYEKDCELWVEDGKSVPQKITFGKILKLTGVNTIPLKEIGKND